MVMPVDVQQRVDAELGAAWRRCEAVLPEGWSLTFWPPIPGADGGFVQGYTVRVESKMPHVQRYFRRYGEGDTPAAALDALTEALQARK